jgi:hypothetical protein
VFDAMKLAQLPILKIPNSQENLMAIDNRNASLQEPSSTPAQPELLVSAILHLMSHYTLMSQEAGVCLKLASVIERHLQALSVLPELAPVLRATCQRLSEQWAAMIENALSVQQETNFFKRLATGVRLRHN